MKIQVTQQHINNGVKGSGCNCPVALALRDAGFKGFYVTLSKIVSATSDNIPIERPALVMLPYVAVKFIDEFDHHDYVQPIEFELNTEKLTHVS